MNRIENALSTLQDKKEKAFITYITAGLPDYGKTKEIIKAQEKAGTDIIELGIPFSDPVADGPVIQAASYEAIQGGANLEKTFALMKEMRDEGVEIPIVFMMYYNTVLHYGLEKFVKECGSCGVDGLIIPDLPLEEQEILNAVYCGPFVTKAKEVFSNSQNSNTNKWSAFLRGNVKRQAYLHTALEWVSRGEVSRYMSLHRNDDNIREMETYFNSVIDWASGVFTHIEKEMCGLPWGEFYERYHKQPYDPSEVADKQRALYEDFYVKNKKGIYEYILGGCKDTKLLEVRCFDEPTKKSVYARQTAEAKQSEVSNCPLCAMGHDANRSRIWKLTEMDADHVTAWSKGGATDITNCQMLCQTHNRAKGNK